MTTGLDRPMLGRSTLAALSGALLVAAPSLAEACAVCFGDRDSNWTPAFYAGTLLMLLLPPTIVVTAAILLYRATKRQEAKRAARERAELGYDPVGSR